MSYTSVPLRVDISMVVFDTWRALSFLTPALEIKVQSAPSSQNTTAFWSEETTAVLYIAYKIPTLLCTALLLTVVTEGGESWLSSVTSTAVYTWVEFCGWLALHVGVHINVWWVVLLHKIHVVFSWHKAHLWLPKHLKHRLVLTFRDRHGLENLTHTRFVACAVMYTTHIWFSTHI